MDNIAPDGGYFFTRITDKKTKHCCFLPWMANTGSEP